MGRPARKRCQRCVNDRTATTTETISFSGSTYEIDLCESHADALYRDLYAWARIGRDTSAVVKAQLSEKDRSNKVVFPMARRVEVVEPKVKPTYKTRVSELPAKAEHWRLTSHALERCAERGIVRDNALWAAVEPTIDRPSVAECPDIRLRRRGTTVAVVDTFLKTVITVWDEAAPKHEQESELDYAAKNYAA